MLKIGIIGYGTRINYIVQELLKTERVHIAAVADINCGRVKEKYLYEEKFNDVKYYEDAEEMLKNELLDGVCIGTRCSTHTKYAVLVAKYNLPLFLEKPVAVCDEDVEKLSSIISISNKVVVSFPLRLSRIITYVKELLDADKIGKVIHVQAYNNVPYGRVYFHDWYRNENETGGLFLQKATHDLDYINYLLGEDKPVRVCAMNSKQVFKGDKPAGLKCIDCEERCTCTESPQNVNKNHGSITGEWCCFAQDTGNEDSGSALIEYGSGMHVAYSQNFVARNDAGKRGARLIGYKGTIEFDWYKAEVNVYNHLECVSEKHKFVDDSGSHFGGDDYLINNFIDVMTGKDVSHSTLAEGILSAKMCLLCKRSAQEKKFFELN